jgi:hypothetical protein
MASLTERNQDATVYVGGLDEKVTEHLLAELFIQGSCFNILHDFTKIFFSRTSCQLSHAKG